MRTARQHVKPPRRLDCVFPGLRAGAILLSLVACSTFTSELENEPAETPPHRPPDRTR